MDEHDKKNFKKFLKSSLNSIKGFFLALLLMLFLSESTGVVQRNENKKENKVSMVITKPIIETKIKKEDGKILFCGQKVKKEDISFLLDFIASTESQGHIFRPKDEKIRQNAWKQVSKRSTAIGKWQFLKSTRESIAKELNEPVPTKKQFLADTTMQIRFMVRYLEDLNQDFCDSIRIYEKNKKHELVLKKTLPSAYEMFCGKVINGYYISKTGMICMGHGIGSDGTIKWLMQGCDPDKLPRGVAIADRRLTIKDIFKD